MVPPPPKQKGRESLIVSCSLQTCKKTPKPTPTIPFFATIICKLAPKSVSLQRKLAPKSVVTIQKLAPKSANHYHNHFIINNYVQKKD